MESTINIKRYPTLTEQLLRMQPGQEVEIPFKEFKLGSVKTTCKRLNRMGYNFKVSEAGLSISSRVTRIA